jgi:hypothetical protein
MWATPRIYTEADARHELAVKVVNENLPSDLEEGRGPFKAHQLSVEYSHTCHNSPLGHCVYDDEEDPCNDNCLYCHEPEERK